MDEEERLNYKREFDQDHQEYKSLQAELESINQELAELDAQMNTHPEGSPEFLVSISNNQLHASHSLQCVWSKSRHTGQDRSLSSVYHLDRIR